MSLGILCPGQGAQSAAMFDLVAGQPAANAVIRLAEAVLGREMSDMLADSSSFIFSNAAAQPLICTAQLAIWTELKPLLPEVRAFAGYSIGELAAYGCAGALTAADVILLARQRALAMDEACPQPCRMVAVEGLRHELLDSLAAQMGVHLAIINARDSFVVGGRACGIDDFEISARAAGANVTPLPVYVASHTPLMAAAAPTLRTLLNQAAINVPSAPVLAGIDGSAVRTRERVVGTLSDQLSTPIDWPACIQGLLEAGCTTLLELGPGNHLARKVVRKHPGIRARSVSDFRTITGIAAWVGASVAAVRY